MDRGRKGILGIGNNKDHPMMFSFCPVKGDEWPSGSDDSDEDFDPSVATYEMADSGRDVCMIVNPNKSTRRKEKLAQKKKKERSTKTKGKINSKDDKKRERPRLQKRMKKTSTSLEEAANESNCSGVSRSGGDISNWERLPLIIIERIFHFVVKEEGPLPFLLRMSRVSRMWREAAKTSSLWKSVNLSSSAVKIKRSRMTEALLWLLDHRFSKLEALNLSNWSKLHHTTLMKVIEKCPGIKRINLTGCIKLNAASVSALVDDLPNLISVDLANLGPLGQTVSPATISHLLEKKGSQLEELHLSNNNLRKWPSSMKPFLIPNGMPKLKLLDLSNCSFNHATSGVFPVETFQHACPNLEVLRLAGCGLTCSKVSAGMQASSPGFPRLTQLSFPIQMVSCRVSNWPQQDILQRLLKTSEKLQLLDIRGRASFNEDFIQNLPCTDVKYLYIGSCDETIFPLCQKWGHSLIVVNLSDLTLTEGYTICDMLPFMKILQDLDVSGSDIDNADLRIIFRKCTSLTDLKLKGCRSLPRGLKQSFTGERLKQLAADIIKSAD